MPKFHVARSTTIAAPIDQITPILCDYRQWPVWSPWFISEPDAQLEYNDKQGEEGAAYMWSGDLTGAGSMRLVSISDAQLAMDLEFLKPFKSQAKITFDLQPTAEGTEVTWNMYGGLPFFMFFMVKSMKLWIGMDYERGLRMLKEYVETSAVASKVEIAGIVNTEAQRYVGLANGCALDKIGEVMPEDFIKLNDCVQEHALTVNNPPLAIYQTFDPANQHSEFITAIPIADSTAEIPAPFIVGELPAGRALKVTHTGKYPHLGNAWATAMTYARHHKIKTQKSPVGVEVYVNNPDETAEDALISQVLLPLR